LDDAADAGEVAASDVPQLLASFVDGLGVDTPPPAPPRAASPISSPATSTVLQLHHLLLKDAAELKAMLHEMDDSLAAACFELPSWRTLLTFIINKKGAENRMKDAVSNAEARANVAEHQAEMAKQQLRAATMKMEAQQKRVAAAANKAANAPEEVQRKASLPRTR